MEFTFPFSSCEKAGDGVAQPYSSFINFVTCCVFFYFLVVSKSNPSRILLSTLLAFEAYHTFSHVVHLQDRTQMLTVHVLAYCINAAFLYFFANLTHHSPSILLVGILLALAALDIYSFMNLPILAYIATQTAIFFVVYLFYYKWLPPALKNGFVWIFGIAGIILLAIWNEMKNCDAMMKWWVAPHVIVELLGLVMFTIIGNLFH